MQAVVSYDSYVIVPASCQLPHPSLHQANPGTTASLTGWVDDHSDVPVQHKIIMSNAYQTAPFEMNGLQKPCSIFKPSYDINAGHVRAHPRHLYIAHTGILVTMWLIQHAVLPSKHHSKKATNLRISTTQNRTSSECASSQSLHRKASVKNANPT